MSVANLLGLALRRSELEVRSDIIVQLVFPKQVLPPVVFTRVTIGNRVRVNQRIRFPLNVCRFPLSPPPPGSSTH
jgi:hypothetical protein